MASAMEHDAGTSLRTTFLDAVSAAMMGVMADVSGGQSFALASGARRAFLHAVADWLQKRQPLLLYACAPSGSMLWNAVQGCVDVLDLNREQKATIEPAQESHIIRIAFAATLQLSHPPSRAASSVDIAMLQTGRLFYALYGFLNEDAGDDGGIDAEQLRQVTVGSRHVRPTQKRDRQRVVPTHEGGRLQGGPSSRMGQEIILDQPCELTCVPSSMRDMPTCLMAAACAVLLSAHTMTDVLFAALYGSCTQQDARVDQQWHALCGMVSALCKSDLKSGHTGVFCASVDTKHGFVLAPLPGMAIQAVRGRDQEDSIQLTVHAHGVDRSSLSAPLQVSAGDCHLYTDCASDFAEQFVGVVYDAYKQLTQGNASESRHFNALHRMQLLLRMMRSAVAQVETMRGASGPIANVRQDDAGVPQNVGWRRHNCQLHGVFPYAALSLRQVTVERSDWPAHMRMALPSHMLLRASMPSTLDATEAMKQMTSVVQRRSACALKVCVPVGMAPLPLPSSANAGHTRSVPDVTLPVKLVKATSSVLEFNDGRKLCVPQSCSTALQPYALTLHASTHPATINPVTASVCAGAPFEHALPLNSVRVREVMQNNVHVQTTTTLVECSAEEMTELRRVRGCSSANVPRCKEIFSIACLHSTHDNLWRGRTARVPYLSAPRNGFTTPWCKVLDMIGRDRTTVHIQWPWYDMVDSEGSDVTIVCRSDNLRNVSVLRTSALCSVSDSLRLLHAYQMASAAIEFVTCMVTGNPNVDGVAKNAASTTCAYLNYSSAGEHKMVQMPLVTAENTKSAYLEDLHRTTSSRIQELMERADVLRVHLTFTVSSQAIDTCCVDLDAVQMQAQYVPCADNDIPLCKWTEDGWKATLPNAAHDAACRRAARARMSVKWGMTAGSGSGGCAPNTLQAEALIRERLSSMHASASERPSTLTTLPTSSLFVAFKNVQRSAWSTPTYPATTFAATKVSRDTACAAELAVQYAQTLCSCVLASCAAPQDTATTLQCVNVPWAQKAGIFPRVELIEESNEEGRDARTQIRCTRSVVRYAATDEFLAPQPSNAQKEKVMAECPVLFNSDTLHHAMPSLAKHRQMELPFIARGDITGMNVCLKHYSLTTCVITAYVSRPREGRTLTLMASLHDADPHKAVGSAPRAIVPVTLTQARAGGVPGRNVGLPTDASYAYSYASHVTVKVPDQNVLTPLMVQCVDEERGTALYGDGFTCTGVKRQACVFCLAPPGFTCTMQEKSAHEWSVVVDPECPLQHLHPLVLELARA